MKTCLGILKQIDEKEISTHIAEVAAQHVTTHDIILIYGESEVYLSLLQEIKSVDCSVLYIESSVARNTLHFSPLLVYMISYWFLSYYGVTPRLVGQGVIEGVLLQAEKNKKKHDLHNGAGSVHFHGASHQGVHGSAGHLRRRFLSGHIRESFHRLFGANVFGSRLLAVSVIFVHTAYDLQPKEFVSDAGSPSCQEGEFFFG